LELPKGKLRSLLEELQKGDVLLRLALCAVAAMLMWVATGAWAPPFAFRTRYVPPRQLTARVAFNVLDQKATEKERERARTDVTTRYANDPEPIIQLQNALINKVVQVLSAKEFGEVDAAVWDEFFPLSDTTPVSEEIKQASFTQFRGVFVIEEGVEGDNVAILRTAIAAALQPYIESGLLENLEHELSEGSQTEILVHPKGNPSASRLTTVEQVRIGEVGGELESRLKNQLTTLTMQPDERDAIAKRLYVWLSPRLPTTLHYDLELTDRARDEAVDKVAPVMFQYEAGKPLAGIEAGKPLTETNLRLLRQEHAAMASQMDWWQATTRSFADFGMYIALYLLCGIYIYYREPRLLTDPRRFVTLLAFVVITVAVVWQAARDQWRVELIFILLFGMTISVAYRQDVALLLSAAISLVSVISLGLGLSEFVIFVSAAAAAIMLAREIRTRTRLIFAGLCSAAVAFSTALGVQVMLGQPLGAFLVLDAGWYAFNAIVASILITGMLPFIEKIFDFQTDLSLLELGDQSHPLLQELVRRAPGTYNHSINVASIGEAAADSIGANGLLVRVGSYFHDIGKMLKPGYFIENQGEGANRHESLVAAMSSLVIIAHVKDGAELARSHRLPQCIIDFIEQHHGTTLVAYFYNQASKASEADPDGQEVDEANFRYPGPKPQTKEAAVMMLSDAVESASRTLEDPGPARIESLVEKIAMAKLLDGQFDECELTLQELHLVQQSLIKSLTAVFHGRVKYPTPEPV